MIQIPFGAFANVSVPADVDVTVAVPQADPLNFLTAQQPFQIVVFTAPAAEGGGGGVTSWNDLEDKPTSFPPSAHDQSFGTITGVDQHKLLGRHANGEGAAQQIGVDGGLEFNGGNIRVQFGTTASTACAGNDERLSNSRAPTGSAGGDLGGSYPNPTVSMARGIRETSGPTNLAVGAWADGQELVRAGATAVGAARPLRVVGSGAISAHVPDNTTAGGNARGANAVDLQSGARTSAVQVASGAQAFIGGGLRNAASAANCAVVCGTENNVFGQCAVVVGGDRNAAFGTNSGVFSGELNSASGLNSWIPGGRLAATRSLTAAYAWASTQRATGGDTQRIGQPVQRTTTDSTPLVLSADRANPAAATVMVLPNNSSWSGLVQVMARDTSGNVAKWTFDVIGKRGANAASTVISEANVLRTFADVALSTAAVSIIADTTLGALTCQVTGVAATTIDWWAEFFGGQIVR